MPDLTLKEAVEYLSYDEENYQQCGATFIQHVTFKEERAKQEVRASANTPVYCEHVFLTCTDTPAKNDMAVVIQL